LFTACLSLFHRIIADARRGREDLLTAGLLKRQESALDQRYGLMQLIPTSVYQQLADLVSSPMHDCNILLQPKTKDLKPDQMI
jgi:hypothetical protein